GFEEISSTLQHYIDGAKAGDDELVRKAFLPQARIQGAYGGKPVDWTLEEFCGVIAKGGQPPSSWPGMSRTMSPGRLGRHASKSSTGDIPATPTFSYCSTIAAGVSPARFSSLTRAPSA